MLICPHNDEVGIGSLHGLDLRVTHNGFLSNSVTTIRFNILGKVRPRVRNCYSGHWRWPNLIWTLHIPRAVKMLWLIICYECEITALYIVL